jgi:hypothetical protein
MRDTLTYRIDAHDTVSAVGDGWDTFALANDAPDTTAEHVVGRSIWDCIAGSTTRQIYHALFDRTRSGTVVRIGIRCDGPAVRRALELQLVPEPDGGITVTVETRRVERRTREHLLDRTLPRGEDILAVCGWCKRVEAAEGRWIEVEDAMLELGLFERVTLPEITHGMCPECFEQLSADLDV